MRRVILVLACVLAMLPHAASAQDAAATSQKKPDEGQRPAGPQFNRTLTNVQVELTLTDQRGSAPGEKKTVNMIVASGNWGKIRNTAASMGPLKVGLNVDARPLVSTDGLVQLELTLYYYPPQGKPDAPVLQTELNQSMTIILQSGKPMLISQSADPASDRKVTVEVRATILK